MRRKHIRGHPGTDPDGRATMDPIGSVIELVSIHGHSDLYGQFGAMETRSVFRNGANSYSAEYFFSGPDADRENDIAELGED